MASSASDTPNAATPGNWMERNPQRSNLITGISVAIVTSLCAWVIATAAESDDAASDGKPTAVTAQDATADIDQGNDSETKGEILFSGKIKNMPEGYLLWALVKDPGANKYFIPSSPCTVEPDNTWSCGNVRVGNSKDIGKKSIVNVALVDAEGVRFIDDYQARHLQGIKDLPVSDHIKILGKIDVTRVK
ncbi:hypothetical protein [Streptomyces antibioticus]|uniref:hypothetical protein n=1 Tax=Streptomyces antibioticus TaxID=1890 RepID=UPI003F44B59F